MSRSTIRGFDKQALRVEREPPLQPGPLRVAAIACAAVLLALIPFGTWCQDPCDGLTCSIAPMAGPFPIGGRALVTTTLTFPNDPYLCREDPRLDWGDGTHDGVGYDTTVSGHHYTTPGDKIVTLKIVNTDNNQVLCSGTAAVTVMPCQIAPLTITYKVMGLSSSSAYVAFTFTSPQAYCGDNTPGTTVYDYHLSIAWGDGTTADQDYYWKLGPYTFNKYYYNLDASPFTVTATLTATPNALNPGLPVPEPVSATKLVDIYGPGECLNPGRDGGIQWCANRITQMSDKVIFQGNTVANEMLYFTGDVTITGPNAPKTGVLTTDGDIFVKLSKGNEILLKGPGLSFDVDGASSTLLPRMEDDSATYYIGLQGMPMYVRGMPITLQSGGVRTESVFYAGLQNMLNLATCKAVQLYPPGGKRALLSAEVLAMDATIAPSVKFLSISLTYDPDLDKLEGKFSMGFPFFDALWSLDLNVRVVQGCLNGYDMTTGLPGPVPFPLGPTGMGLRYLTIKMDGICVGQFTIFVGGDLQVVSPIPIPTTIMVIKDSGIQYYWPLSLEWKAGTTTLMGWPLGQTSGRVNLNSLSGTFKTSGNILDILQGDLRFDLIVPKAWFMGRFSGKIQIPDIQCSWANARCRVMRTLIRSAVTLPLVIDEQTFDFNAHVKLDGTSFAFFRGMVNTPVLPTFAVLVESQSGEVHLLIGRNLDDLYEVTEAAPTVRLSPESAEKPLVLSQPADSVIFSASADSVIPSITLQTPAGSTVTPATVSTFPGVTYASSDEDKVALFRMENASAGTWTLRVDNLSADQVTFQALAPKAPPTTTFTSVTKSGDSVSISASVTPASATTTVTLLYSQNDDGSVEGMIAQDLPATSGTISTMWDTSAVPTGNYYIVARTDDGMNTPVLTVYALPIGVDQGLLQPPIGLAGSRSGSTATLSWTPSPSSDSKGHVVLYTDDPQKAGYPFSAAAKQNNGTVLEGLDPVKEYRACVVAYNESGGLSPQSNTVALLKPGNTPGDCDGNGSVSIGEVQKAINMFLGTFAVSCDVDANGNGTVSIGEVQLVVNAFLGVVPGVGVSVSPGNVILSPNGTQQFTSTVTGTTNMAVTWSVPEGATGGSITGTGLYTAPASPGSYHVKATSQADSSKSGSATVTVTQAPSCTLACTASAGPTSGQAPLPVSFTSTATPSDCPGGVTFAWTFGDGASSTQQNPSHTYAAAGTFTWSLTVSVSGVTCSKSGSVTVAAPPGCSITCTASATPASGTAPLGVDFAATATATNCSGGTTYAWTFGDGATSSQQNASHTFPSAGTYTWTLTTGVDGQTCQRSGSVTVTAPTDGTPLTLGVPVGGSISGAAINASWNWYYLDVTAAQAVAVGVTGLTGDVDLYVRFDEKPDLSTFFCRSWNNGTTAEECIAPFTGPSRLWVGVTNYAVGGPFQFTVTASIATCAVTSCEATVTPASGLEVDFVGRYMQTGCVEGPLFLWVFGDGGQSYEQAGTHTFAAPGTYPWTFSVTVEGDTCDLSGSVTVP